MAGAERDTGGSGEWALPDVIDGTDRRYRVLPHNVELAARLYPLLVEAAKERGTPTYKGLALRLEVHHRQIEHGLRIIQHWCAAIGAPPLTGLVVGAHSKRPGSGYLEGSGDAAEDRARVHAYNWPRTVPFGGGAATALSPTDDAIAQISEELEEDDFDGNEFEPESVEDARERVHRSIALRRGQQKFRRTLLKVYGRQCAISECEVEDVLEAAHIVPYCDGGPNHVQNGILLRADLHTLMDLDLLALVIDDAGVMRVRLAEALQVSSYEHLDGVELALPVSPSLQPSPTFVARRWKASATTDRFS
ncbi:MAG: HNH endonuclease [Thermoleophilia bacterium]|nr:HNH endonuclease [Thermoleophilia bacterium]